VDVIHSGLVLRIRAGVASSSPTAERAARIDALTPDRRDVPPETSLPPVCPDMLRGEQRITRLRGDQGESRLSLLRRLLAAGDRELPIRAPRPRRS